MREHLVRLNRETEMLGRFGDPVLDGRLFYQLAEGVVDFDRVQFRSVEVQKFLLRKFLWIEIGLPCRIRPSGGANVETRHNRFSSASTSGSGQARSGIIPCGAFPRLTSLSSSSSFASLGAAALRSGRRCRCLRSLPLL